MIYKHFNQNCLLSQLSAASKRMLLKWGIPSGYRPPSSSEANPLGVLTKERAFKNISRHILESDNQLIFKRQKRSGEAAQEFEASQLARFLLPKDLSPPCAWGYFKGTLITEKQIGTPFSMSNREQIGLAIDFLVKLHSTKISDELFQVLVNQGFDHYFGQTLKRRLYQEVQLSQLAFGKIKHMKSLIKELREGVTWILENFSLEVDPVLGHGDFQSNNLLVIDGRLQPLDWIDFGLCERAYEIVHLTSKLGEEDKNTAFKQYYEKVQAVESENDLLRKGMAIDAVVQAGACARKVCNGMADATDSRLQFRFRRRVQRLLYARSLG